jgi:succinate-semialdehyde dehydrogenase/glutarate-semialdehyde dehydrogenase
MAYRSINPNNCRTLKSFEHLTSAQLEHSLAAADTCFKTWKHTSYAERAVVLSKAAALMHAHVDDFAKLATLEMGKRIDEARGEVKFSADILAYCAKNAESFLAPVRLHQRRVRGDRCGARDRRQRRREPCRAHRQVLAHLRHADPER